MANDWIKMRVSLCTHPKVIAITAMLEADPEIGKALTSGASGPLRCYVTRNVTRDVTLASLLRVWGAANEHTSDGVWTGILISDLDYIAEVPGFGEMMQSVGWAIPGEDSEGRPTIELPNFLENNVPSKSEKRSKEAERQRKYRERKRNEARNEARDSHVTRHVTRNVTPEPTYSAREEKRREENKDKKIKNRDAQFEIPKSLDTAEFREVWEDYRAWYLANSGKRLDPIKERHQLYEIASSGVEKAIADIRFTIRSSSKPGAIWDSQREFGKQGAAAPKKRRSVSEMLEEDDAS